MSWEQEQVAGYKQRRQQEEQRGLDEAEKLRLINVEAPYRWTELRDALMGRCERLNSEAGSSAFLSVSFDSFLNQLIIVREDDHARLQCRYEPAFHTAKFSSPDCPICNKEFSIDARAVQGSMKVVWIEGTRAIADPGAIAEWMLDVFLKF